MATKSKREYPFLVLGFLPKGHGLGLKNRESIRKSYFKTKEKAEQEIESYNLMNVKSQLENR